MSQFLRLHLLLRVIPFLHLLLWMIDLHLRVVHLLLCVIDLHLRAVCGTLSVLMGYVLKWPWTSHYARLSAHLREQASTGSTRI